MPLTDPWFWAFLGAFGWVLGFAVVGTDTLGRRLGRTDGLYGVVRHPLMVCDALWAPGWSLVFGSLVGVLVTPVWWMIIWTLTEVEEVALVREYGDAYREFQSRVPRLVPRLGIGRRRAG